MKFILICLLLINSAIILFARDTFGFSYIKPNDDTKSVLVLAPGMNTNGEFFLGESPWMDFARRN